MDIQQLNIQDRISCVKFLKVLIFNVLHNHDAKFRKINLTHDIVRER